MGLTCSVKEIGLLDEGYQTTVQNYRKNLEQMLLTARGHGVPVLLSTLVANLKDFYPLRSDCGRGDLSRELDLLVGQGRVREAVQLCEEELNETPYCAICHFELGRLHYLQGEYRKASKEFVYARDMDRLPFRAPTVFNRIIRRLAGAAEGQILLSDSGERFARASPHRIVGDELITEYLHPTVYGHYLIALNMVEVLAPDPVGRRWGKGDTDRVKNYDEYARQLGYSLRDRISHRNDLILFLRKMPYTAPPPVLRRRVAALIREQVEDVLQLNPAPYRDFVDRGGLVFLARMLDFLLPGGPRSAQERTRGSGEEDIGPCPRLHPQRLLLRFLPQSRLVALPLPEVYGATGRFRGRRAVAGGDAARLLRCRFVP